jgi:hypothetical protein
MALHSRAHRGTPLKFALQVEAALIDEVVPRARAIPSTASTSAQTAAPASEGQRLQQPLMARAGRGIVPVGSTSLTCTE